LEWIGDKTDIIQITDPLYPLTIASRTIMINLPGWPDDRGTYCVEESPHSKERDAG